MTTNKKGVYREIQIDKLFIDHTYQRQINGLMVKKIVTKFDEKLIGVLKVIERKNGMFSVVDGQHRLSVLKTIGCDTVPCLIYQAITVQEEIIMFKELNQNVNKLNALELFWALVGGGDKESIAILEVVEKNGLKVSKRTGERVFQKDSIAAIGIVKRIVKEHKLEILDKTLNFVTKVWPANGEALTGQLMEGIAIFSKRHLSDPAYNAKNAHKKFSLLDIPMVIARARNHAKIYDTATQYIIADLLCEAYNKGLSKDKKLTWASNNQDGNS